MATSTPKRKQWDYKTISHIRADDWRELDDQMEGWGKLGWELVSAFAVGDKYRLFFKRPLK